MSEWTWIMSSAVFYMNSQPSNFLPLGGKALGQHTFVATKYNFLMQKTENYNIFFNAFLALSLSGLPLGRSYISAKDASTHLFTQAIPKTTRKIPLPQINKDVKKQGIYLLLELTIKRSDGGIGWIWTQYKWNYGWWDKTRCCRMSIIFAFLALIMIFAKTKFPSTVPISKYLPGLEKLILNILMLVTTNDWLWLVRNTEVSSKQKVDEGAVFIYTRSHFGVIAPIICNLVAHFCCIARLCFCKNGPHIKLI